MRRPNRKILRTLAAAVSLAATYCLQVFRYCYDEAMTLELRVDGMQARSIRFCALAAAGACEVAGRSDAPAALLCLCWCVAEFWL